ncbi:hypothetical protein [Niabella hirudinis]|uniref:hypothetical protein n=1 Tax=Niabella hirudinis TaxID=1285929 RepID=UPI003EBE4F82
MSKARYMIGCVIGLLIHTLSQAQKLPALGDAWQGKISGETFFMDGNNLYPSVQLVVDSVRYTVAIDTKKENLVKCILTTDKRFAIHGDPVLGKPFSTFRNRDQAKYSRGNGYFVPLDEDWYAVFHFKPISDTSRCIAVLKKRF